MPLLSCLLVEADKNGLRVTGSDLDVTTAVTVPCAVKAVGKVAVSARHFNEVVRKIPRGPLQLTIAGEQCEVRYGDGKGWSRFPIQDASDFPRVPELKAENQASLAGDALARLITRTLYAASSDATRPNLSGVFIQGGDKQLTCVATDGHRLAYAATVLSGGLPRQEVIVPRKTVLELSKLLADSDEEVNVEISATQAAFRFGTIELVSKLIDGKFPDYTRVIPAQHKNKLQVGREALRQALLRAAILSNEKFRGVRWVLTDGSLKIVSSNAEQEEAHEEVEVKYSGDALDIGFNVNYLLDVLNNVSGNDIECAFGDASSSALISYPTEQDFRYVVMPMRI